MTWRTAYFCVKCEGRLSRDQVFYNDGRCSLCGFADPNACTIVEYKTKGYRVRKVYPDGHCWWKFWQKPMLETEWQEDAGWVKK